MFFSGASSTGDGVTFRNISDFALFVASSIVAALYVHPKYTSISGVGSSSSTSSCSFAHMADKNILAFTWKCRRSQPCSTSSQSYCSNASCNWRCHHKPSKRWPSKDSGPIQCSKFAGRRLRGNLIQTVERSVAILLSNPSFWLECTRKLNRLLFQPFLVDVKS